MKIKAILFLTMLIPLGASASDSQERIYLTQVVNQLNAIKPLIVSASKEQPKTNRIQFHYTFYRDAGGTLHNGLLEDINAIEEGINVKLNRIPSELHIFLPIKGDYIDHQYVVERK